MPADRAAAGGGAVPSPWTLSWRDWKQVLRRTWSELGDDNVGLIAAGAAFYGFLAIVPALGATVLLYGLLADPQTLRDHIGALFDMLPPDAARAAADQLATVVETSGAKKGLGLVVALALAVYGASKGASAILTALNIAYGLKGRRGFIAAQLTAFAIVGGGLALMLAALAVNSALAWLGQAIPSPALELLIHLLGYLMLGAVVLTGAACLYRFGPDHPEPRWVWLSPGAVVAALLWLAGTAGFGVYAANFGSYGATYGSLSAVVVLLTWLWLSAYVFLLGAELNSELQCHAEARARPAATPAALPAVRPADAAPPAAPAPRPAPAHTPGGLATAATATIGARAGGGRLPLVQALLTGAGLARLRRGAPNGLVLVAGSAALAWFSRSRR